MRATSQEEGNGITTFYYLPHVQLCLSINKKSKSDKDILYLTKKELSNYGLYVTQLLKPVYFVMICSQWHRWRFAIFVE